jgi:prophage regulatory protein
MVLRMPVQVMRIFQRQFCHLAKEIDMTAQLQNALSILRRKQVQARTGLSRSTLYQFVSDGTFPKPVKLGARAVGWVESEISDWLTQQIEQSRKAA